MENSTHEELKKLGIGRKIRALREEKGISLEALGWDIETGMPGQSTVDDLGLKDLLRE